MSSAQATELVSKMFVSVNLATARMTALKSRVRTPVLAMASVFPCHREMSVSASSGGRVSPAKPTPALITAPARREESASTVSASAKSDSLDPTALPPYVPMLAMITDNVMWRLESASATKDGSVQPAQLTLVRTIAPVMESAMAGFAIVTLDGLARRAKRWTALLTLARITAAVPVHAFPESASAMSFRWAVTATRRFVQRSVMDEADAAILMEEEFVSVTPVGRERVVAMTHVPTTASAMVPVFEVFVPATRAGQVLIALSILAQATARAMESVK